MIHILPRYQTITLSLIAGLTASWLIGCDSQADPDYSGEPLATITGAIQNEATRAPEEAEAALLYFADAGEGDYQVLQRVAVGNDFPATFEIEVFTPPPDNAFIDLTLVGGSPDESRIAIAYMMALKPGANLENPSDLLGVAEHHMLIYAEKDFLPGTQLEEYFGPLKAGFHIMDVIRHGQPGCMSEEEPFDCMRLAPQDLDTEVPLRLSDEPNVPNVT